MSIQQVSTKRAKLSTILSRRSVVDGFNSVRECKPFDYKKIDEDSEWAWGYERGRILATVYKGKLKEGRYVTPEAIIAYKNARQQGIIL